MTSFEGHLSPMERLKAKSRDIVSLDKIVGLERERIAVATRAPVTRRSAYEGTDAHRAYMREYMRRRRAKLREGNSL